MLNYNFRKQLMRLFTDFGTISNTPNSYLENPQLGSKIRIDLPWLVEKSISECRQIPTSDITTVSIKQIEVWKDYFVVLSAYEVASEPYKNYRAISLMTPNFTIETSFCSYQNQQSSFIMEAIEKIYIDNQSNLVYAYRWNSDSIEIIQFNDFLSNRLVNNLFVNRNAFLNTSKYNQFNKDPNRIKFKIKDDCLSFFVYYGDDRQPSDHSFNYSRFIILNIFDLNDNWMRKATDCVIPYDTLRNMGGFYDFDFYVNKQDDGYFTGALVSTHKPASLAEWTSKREDWNITNQIELNNFINDFNFRKNTPNWRIKDIKWQYSWNHYHYQSQTAPTGRLSDDPNEWGGFRRHSTDTPGITPTKTRATYIHKIGDTRVNFTSATNQFIRPYDPDFDRPYFPDWAPYRIYQEWQSQGSISTETQKAWYISFKISPSGAFTQRVIGKTTSVNSIGNVIYSHSDKFYFAYDNTIGVLSINPQTSLLQWDFVSTSHNVPCLNLIAYNDVGYNDIQYPSLLYLQGLNSAQSIGESGMIYRYGSLQYANKVTEASIQNFNFFDTYNLQAMRQQNLLFGFIFSQRYEFVTMWVQSYNNQTQHDVPYQFAPYDNDLKNFLPQRVQGNVNSLPMFDGTVNETIPTSHSFTVITHIENESMNNIDVPKWTIQSSSNNPMFDFDKPISKTREETMQISFDFDTGIKDKTNNKDVFKLNASNSLTKTFVTQDSHPIIEGNKIKNFKLYYTDGTIETYEARPYLSRQNDVGYFRISLANLHPNKTLNNIILFNVNDDELFNRVLQVPPSGMINLSIRIRIEE